MGHQIIEREKNTVALRTVTVIVAHTFNITNKKNINEI